jgi:hypothetical protein
MSGRFVGVRDRHGVSHVVDLFLAFLFILPSAGASALPDNPHCTYRSPLAGAGLLSPATNLIMRFNLPVSATSLGNAQFSVTGSSSGLVSGALRLSDDGYTVLYKPANHFALGETVHVELSGGILSAEGSDLGPLAWQFVISPGIRTQSTAVVPGPLATRGPLTKLPVSPIPGEVWSAGDDSLPADFPFVRVVNNDSTVFGAFSLINVAFDTTIPNTPYLMVLNESGKPLFHRKLPSNGFDFKRQEVGMYTYYVEEEHLFVGLDSAFQRTATYKAGNGYTTDLHELRLLPDGHALLLSLDSQMVDMSKLAVGGSPTALVMGDVLQELDKSGDVVFQWRSWDYFRITDATLTDFTAPLIDPVHMNAIEVDSDGNILISSRHNDEITKINRTTGEIMWRLGGYNNQFTLLGDTLWFSHQHAIRLLPNGHYTLFDNGNGHNPQYSRAIELSLDTLNKTCRFVWQYARPRYDYDSTYSQAMGNVQRLANGNTLIGWGATSPALSIVTPGGAIAYELWLPYGVFSYRALMLQRPPLTTEVNATGGLPQRFSLDQNYPNPFNPSTRIKYTVGGAGEAGTGGLGLGTRNVRLAVFDVLGREVAVLVNEKKAPGNYEVSFDASGLASGVYFYRLTAGPFVESKKMLLLR